MALNIIPKTIMVEYQGGQAFTILSTTNNSTAKFYIIQQLYVSRANFGGGVNQDKPSNYFNIEMLYVNTWFPIYRFSMQSLNVEGAQGLDGFSQGGTSQPAEMGYARSVISKDNPIYIANSGSAIRGNYGAGGNGRISISMSYLEMQSTVTTSLNGAWNL